MQIVEREKLNAPLLKRLYRTIAFRARWQRAVRATNIRMPLFALAVRDVKVSVRACQDERRRVPACRNETEHFTMLRVRDANHTDRIIVRIRYV